MLIGIAGPLAVGKDTVGAILKEEGFVNFSYGDVLRDECDRRGIPKDRPTLVRIADEFRAKDPAYLSKLLLKRIKSSGVAKALLTGIRTPSEVAELRKDPSFVLVWVDAPLELRYARIHANPRDERDTISFEEFKAHDEREWHGINTHISFSKIKLMADVEIQNDKGLKELREQALGVLNRIRQES
ncbi:AAA family ATPase [Candidatus Woesearchaeota archaeon]|nr:AAA family ATPase [Candidatus Woesearchaeota archaeon]